MALSIQAAERMLQTVDTFMLQKSKLSRRLIAQQTDDIRFRSERGMELQILQWWNGVSDTVVWGLHEGRLALKKGLLEKAAWKADWVDWDCLEEGGKHRTTPPHTRIYQEGAKAAAAQLGIAFDIPATQAIEWAKEHAAQLVTGLAAEAKKRIRELVVEGLEQGTDVWSLARKIKLDLPLSPYQRGILQGRIDKLHPSLLDSSGKLSQHLIDREMIRMRNYRAGMIARTEMVAAQSEGALIGYEATGVTEVELVANAGACDVCAALNGHHFTLAQASGIIPLHMFCLCVWVPIKVGRKTLSMDSKKPTAARHRPKTLEPIKPGKATKADAEKTAKWFNGMEKHKHYEAALDKNTGLHSVETTVGLRGIDKLSIKRKKEVVARLCKRTGLPESSVSKFMGAWADTSNTSYSSMLAQERAAKMFGTKLSPWQKKKWAKMKRYRSTGAGVKEARMSLFETNIGVLDKGVLAAGYKTKEKATDAMLRAMYETTQEDFKKAGLTHIRLFRGVGDRKDVAIKTLGHKMQSKGANVLESWTTQVDKADLFAMERGGDVFAADIPVSRILSSPKTGFGCTSEAELVVLGTADDVSAHIGTYCVEGGKWTDRMADDLSRLPIAK